MAPEILLEEKYNESVDIYSFAMCVVELVDRKPPWKGICAPGSVCLQVTQGKTPAQQLNHEWVDSGPPDPFCYIFAELKLWTIQVCVILLHDAGRTKRQIARLQSK